MPNYLNFPDLCHLDAPGIAELQALAAEATVRQQLGEGVYLHHGDPEAEDNVIEVVGIPDASMAGMNMLLLI
jgi:hypothetical protein